MGSVNEQTKPRAEGIVYKSLSGFYEVWVDKETYVTKPKGLFRHRNEKPMVGDHVIIEKGTGSDHDEHRLMAILPRRNALVRPPVANVDVVIVVMSLVEPDFSFALLDQYLLTLEYNAIEAIIVLTKADRMAAIQGKAALDALVASVEAIYSPLGYPVWVKAGTEAFAEAFVVALAPGVHVMMGQSGVGKSSLLNLLNPDLALETSGISQALNRGKHTTRQVTLYRLGQALLADTPGFSAMDLPEIDPINLQDCFPEIAAAALACRFRTCLHDQEPQCHVKSLVDTGEIAFSRYQSYLTALEKVKNRKITY